MSDETMGDEQPWEEEGLDRPDFEVLIRGDLVDLRTRDVGVVEGDPRPWLDSGGQFTDLNWQHRYKVALTREE